MKNLLIIFIAVATIGCCPAKVSQLTKKIEKPQSGTITGIDISSAFRVNVKFGDESSYKIEVPERYADNVVSSIENGILRVYIDGGVSTTGSETFTVDVVAKELNKVRASGAVRVDVLEPISGARLDVNISGASKIDVCGEVEELVMNISGASKAQCGDLRAKISDVNVSGASKAEVNTTQRARYNASGASKISYSGAAVIEQRSSSGASSIRSR